MMGEAGKVLGEGMEEQGTGTYGVTGMGTSQDGDTGPKGVVQTAL